MPLQMTRVRADEEEYWHSSKFRAFTFDDEDDELSQVGRVRPWNCRVGPRSRPSPGLGPARRGGLMFCRWVVTSCPLRRLHGAPVSLHSSHFEISLERGSSPMQQTASPAH